MKKGEITRMHRVVFEASIVGVVTALALWLVLGYLPELTSTPRILATGFGMGVVIHVLFELAGGNAWYCVHGGACQNK